jgi:aldehyde dehydrogenase (NAD+)
VLGVFPRSVEEDAHRAVEAAVKATKGWRSLSRIKRGELFDNFAQIVKGEQEELSRLVTMECGKGINEGRADVVEGIHMVQYVFGTSRMPSGHVVSSEIAEKESYMKRHPKGQVAAISPWNFPFAIPLWLLGPSLLEGNTAVFKPSEDTPLIGHKLAEYFHRAGFPPGVVNVIHGYGEEAGAPLVAHPEIDVVLFTGSYEVGSRIRQVCAEHYNKMAVCEMGGKNALIILEDADMEIALRAAVLSAYKTTGQRCVSAGRMIVHEKILDRFTEEFLNMSRRVIVGNPLSEDVFMGPLINEQGLRKVEYHNEMAIKEGAEILLNGGRLSGKEYDRGFFMSPFVYRMRHSSESFVLREEAFGPHVAIIPVGSLDEAIEVYNDTEYGLSLAVITEDYRKARVVEENCHYGLGYVNLPSIGAEVHLPFGGVKRSGTGMPSAATLIDAVTHRVAWTINHGREIKMAQGLGAEV